MKTIYYTAASLDGFLATEDDSLEWLFPLGDVNELNGIGPDDRSRAGDARFVRSAGAWKLRCGS